MDLWTVFLKTLHLPPHHSPVLLPTQHKLYSQGCICAMSFTFINQHPLLLQTENLQRVFWVHHNTDLHTFNM